MAQGSPFGFVQLEFGFLLGPGDGRYLIRSAAEADPDAVLVLATLGAVERRRLRGRRGRSVERADAEPVPTSRVTVVRAEPFPTPGHAESWLAAVRGDSDRRDAELERALAVVNGALRAYRAARGEPYARDVGHGQALVVRIGYGAGDDVAMGMYRDAWELPRGGRAVKRSMEAPEERFAAILGGRETVLACEELVLRARADVDAGHDREAALQARIALEALLSELPQIHGDRRGPLEADRGPVGEAANAALRGDLTQAQADAVAAAVGRMEAALRARRLESAS